ncbi:oxidoreductase, short-chain dehydrogenase/reductase family [Sorangium cellulosum So ce56]|uniref:Oxidoreductase, short-chain dehydrogenase/reductase family n=2 Tax=Polyangiaceae TaxID=49 RepID=A9FIC6_SORC5|nr:oxidoreductase, short-chain dehydrogenase/reductase family [Sorangium cellulosum So ce56]
MSERARARQGARSRDRGMRASMASKLAGRVVLITGASSGIGEALAREVARRGGRVVLAARRAQRIEALATEIRRSGGEALATPCDVTRDGDVERAVAQASEAFGRLDIAVANAGFSVAGRVEQLALDDFRRQFETNVFGALRTVKAALPELKRSRGGVALVGSVLGYLAVPAVGAYTMSKFAVRALAETLRAELHAEGVAVTHVAPGYVASEIRRIDNAGNLHEGAPDPVPRWLVMPAQTAARQIMDGIIARRAEVIVTAHGKLGVSLSRHAPGLLRASVSRLPRKRRISER